MLGTNYLSTQNRRTWEERFYDAKELYFFLMNIAFSCFVPTFEDLDKQSFRFYASINSLFVGPILIALVIILFPLQLIVFSIWSQVQKSRAPILYSGPDRKSYADLPIQRHYGIATMNLCLLPEAISRANSLKNVLARAEGIAKVLQKTSVDRCRYEQDGEKKDCCDGLSVSCGVKEFFPQLDFVCVQEAFVRAASEKMILMLRQQFPYALHDCRINSWSTNWYFLNSGLLFLSRHRIVAADFKVFSQKYAHCRLSSLGLLMVKVHVGTEKGQPCVGYVFNTHLQSFPGDKNPARKGGLVHHYQLNEVMKWSQEFQEKTHDSKEKLLFDFVCGDFNMDNISPVDQRDSKHALFSRYTDAARCGPGRDQPWAVGTSLRQRTMHELRTRQQLMWALTEPAQLSRYVLDADVSSANVTMAVPVPPAPGETRPAAVGGKRRLDYLLYRPGLNTELRSFQFCCELATLTDHVPVVATFSVT